MKRAYSPKEIVQKVYKTLEWDGEWEEAFGRPELNSTWFVSGPSASGKSSFVMQLAERLSHFGGVLYVSYEEGLSQSFQERLLREGLDKRQGWFRVVTTDTFDELVARLHKRHSAKFVIIDSFQYAGWSYAEAKDLVDTFPRKSFIFISQEAKGQPLGKAAIRLRYMAGVKVRVIGYRAYCQGRFNPDAGNSYVVWPEGVLRTNNRV